MPRSSVDLLLVGLAGWRLAYLLVYEMGPFDLVDSLREMIGANTHSQASPVPSTFFAKLFACVPCMSFWTLAIVLLYWLAFDTFGEVRDAIRFLGIWGGVTALHVYIEKS